MRGTNHSQAKLRKDTKRRIPKGWFAILIALVLVSAPALLHSYVGLSWAGALSVVAEGIAVMMLMPAALFFLAIPLVIVLNIFRALGDLAKRPAMRQRQRELQAVIIQVGQPRLQSTNRWAHHMGE